MTYGELKEIKTTGFVTNHVIDDVVNNGRFCFGEGFELHQVAAYEIKKIAEWASREEVSFSSWNSISARMRVGGTLGS